MDVASKACTLSLTIAANRCTFAVLKSFDFFILNLFIYKSPLPSKKVAMFEFTSLLQPTFFLKNKKDNNMEILDQLQPLLENIGFPALIFAIWYIYHQSQVKAFEQIIQNNFEILKDLLETNQFHAALLSRIESKIDNNLWCPLLKKEVN